METATLAAGCFWCIEAVFQRLEGVEDIISGFTGGVIKNPPYREVVQGRTGHAEAIQFKFDPVITSYEEILKVFFATHDPTTLNRQQNDVGPQYRSAIFYHSDEQKQTAERVKEELNQEIYDNKIVTEICPAKAFYNAEEIHRNFYNRNPQQPYCQIIINPKLEKLKESFSHKLKPAF